MDRASDLRADYDRLGLLLSQEDDGAKASALVRERRLIGDLLEKIDTPEEVSVADELASRRRTPTKDAGAPSRRRRSGGS